MFRIVSLLLLPINLPEDCLRAAGEHARERIVAAGHRLGSLLAQQDDAASRIEILLDGLAVGTPAEYERIPDIWRHAIEAGKRNDAAELVRLLDLSLPKAKEPLADWQAVVVGGGIINGISQAGQWPQRRLKQLLERQPELESRWSRTIELAAKMADEESVRTGTRYDALRILGADDYDRRSEQLVRYLAAGVDGELHMGAVSGLSDMESPQVAAALIEAAARLNEDNKKLAIEALLRTPERQKTLRKNIENGTIPRTLLTAEQLAQLSL